MFVDKLLELARMKDTDPEEWEDLGETAEETEAEPEEQGAFEDVPEDPGEEPEEEPEEGEGQKDFLPCSLEDDNDLDEIEAEQAGNTIQRKYETVIYADGTAKKQAVQAVQKGSGAVRMPVREHVRKCSKDRLKGVQTPIRTAHSRRKKRNRPYRTIISMAAAVAFFVFGLAATMKGAEARTQTSIYSGFLCVIMLYDVGGLLGRVLAFRSRLLLSLTTILLVIGLYVRAPRWWAVVGAVACVSAILVKFLNAGWLDMESYDLSEEVEKVLTNNATSKAAVEWELRGMKYSRTLAYNLGWEFDNDDLQGLFRPLFLLGFGVGYDKTEKARTRLEKAEAEAESLRSKCKTAEKDLKAYKESEKELNRQITAAREDNQTLSFQVQQLREELEAMTKVKDSLAATNEELVSLMEPEPEKETESKVTPIELINGSIEDTAWELLSSGKSVNEVTRLLNVKRWRIAEISKKVTAEREKKVVSIAATA